MSACHAEVGSSILPGTAKGIKRAVTSGVLVSTALQASLAQQVERHICNVYVTGSIPVGGSKFIFMTFFWTYYLICLAYCIFMFARRWNRDVMSGGLGISPGMDTMAALIMCWVLAPVDITLTWIRLYKEAEEARRDNSKIF